MTEQAKKTPRQSVLRYGTDKDVAAGRTNNLPPGAYELVVIGATELYGPTGKLYPMDCDVTMVRVRFKALRAFAPDGSEIKPTPTGTATLGLTSVHPDTLAEYRAGTRMSDPYPPKHPTPEAEPWYVEQAAQHAATASALIGALYGEGLLTQLRAEGATATAADFAAWKDRRVLARIKAPREGADPSFGVELNWYSLTHVDNLARFLAA